MNKIKSCPTPRDCNIKDGMCETCSRVATDELYDEFDVFYNSLVIQSKYVNDENVDMVNRNFEKLLLKMEPLPGDISEMVTDNFWELL